MAEKRNDYEICLKSSKKAFPSVVYTLKIPNFFKETKYDNKLLKSPTFEFANGSWRFEFLSSIYLNKKEVYVDILKLSFEIPQQKVFYTITLLDPTDDQSHDYNCDVYVFEEDYNDHRMAEFSTDAPCYCEADNLTLIIHLFCDEAVEVEADQKVLHPKERDIELLSQDFKKLFLNGINHDLTLQVSEREFKVHRDVLMARSQVFQNMLSHEMIEKSKGIIEVPDCDPQVMEQFLFYVYTGQVQTLNEDNALGLYYAADKYTMTLLKEECAEFLKTVFSPSIVCDVIQLALNHNDTDLLECATEYFLNHTNDIFPTLEWMSFLKSNLTVANELLIKASKKWGCNK